MTAAAGDGVTRLAVGSSLWGRFSAALISDVFYYRDH